MFSTSYDHDGAAVTRQAMSAGVKRLANFPILWPRANVKHTTSDLASLCRGRIRPRSRSLRLASRKYRNALVGAASSGRNPSTPNHTRSNQWRK